MSYAKSISTKRETIKLKGKKFGKLLVLGNGGPDNVRWLCLCDCGNKRLFGTNALLTRHNTTCGCGKGKQTQTHGMSKTNLYRKWDGITRRCNDPKSEHYIYYGARGIRCKWKTFEEFRDDMYESYLEHVDLYGLKDTTIERINVNGHYCKKNCRWATNKEQSNNRRNTTFINYNNVKYPAAYLSIKLGLDRRKIHNLLRTRTKRQLISMIESGEIYNKETT